jgi:hypothetical protein
MRKVFLLIMSVLREIALRDDISSYNRRDLYKAIKLLENVLKTEEIK